MAAVATPRHTSHPLTATCACVTRILNLGDHCILYVFK